MSRSPAHLRAAAVALRALAAAHSADFDGLAPHSGPVTWEGPAASAHRRRAATATEDARAVASEVVALADRLDQQAADLVAAETAAARRLRERDADGPASTGAVPAGAVPAGTAPAGARSDG